MQANVWQPRATRIPARNRPKKHVSKTRKNRLHQWTSCTTRAERVKTGIHRTFEPSPKVNMTRKKENRKCKTFCVNLDLLNIWFSFVIWEFHDPSAVNVSNQVYTDRFSHHQKWTWQQKQTRENVKAPGLIWTSKSCGLASKYVNSKDPAPNDTEWHCSKTRESRLHQ